MDSTTYKALEYCIWKRIPFAVYRLPNMKKVDFFSAPSLLVDGNADEKVSNFSFIINEFNHPYSDTLRIPCELTAEQTWKQRFTLPVNNFPEPTLPTQEVTEEEYIEQVTQLIETLKQRESAKTVISRIELVYAPLLTICDAVYRLMKHDDTYFKYCFYHPQVGFWMGATPELLLMANKKDNLFTTMSLAGTTSVDSEWDDKNKIEQMYVSNYIMNELIKLGITKCGVENMDVKYGDLKHLCTVFSGGMGDVNPHDILDALNPTPALCGVPKEDALADIARIEKHNRSCYGGYVGFETKDTLLAFVNIRCATFYKSNICLFAGGGVLPYSDPASEWAETEAKLSNVERMFLVE